MRQIWLNKDDFEMFHQDISPLDYEFFRTHVDTFKRMWKEQTRRFWSLFLNTFEHFIWKHGCIKDFPMKSAEVHKYIDEILQYIRDQFVNGKVSSAKNLIYDCVVVTQNRHCITILDRAAYAQNPFYMKETREVFRQLFGAPNDKRTYMKVLCGLPMYVKFAGSAVVALRRWMDAPEIFPENESTKRNYFDNIFRRHKHIEESIAEDLKRLGEMTDEDIAGLARDCLEKAEASATTETSETTEKKKRKKKKKAKSSEDPLASTASTADSSTKPSDSAKSETLTPKTSDPLKTVSDNPPSNETGDSLKDKASELSNPANSVKGENAGDSSKSAKSDSDTVDKENETNNSTNNSSEVKLTGSKYKTRAEPKEQSAESALRGNPFDSTKDIFKQSESSKIVSKTKDTVAMKQKLVKKSISGESTGSVESGGGEETVAKEGREVAKDMVCDGVAARKKLHTCGLCGREEVTAKTFKRCQKCRGKSNPKYYCSRDCQVKDWKIHKLDHKDEL